MKKRNLIRLWSMLLTMLMVVMQLPLTAFANQATTAHAVPKGLLVLGDSIAKGTGLMPGEGNFGDILAASYGLSEPLYNNLAVDGLTSGGLAMAAGSGQFDELLAPYDTVVISIGGNDILGESLKIITNSAGIPANTPNSALPAIIQAIPQEMLNTLMLKVAADLGAYFTPDVIKQKVTDLSANILSIGKVISAATVTPPQVYILTIYNPFSGIPGFEALSNLLEPIVIAMNDSIKATATTIGFMVVDVYTAFNGNAALLTNMALFFDPHPNASGQELIAIKIEENRIPSLVEAVPAYMATTDVNVRTSTSASANVIGYIPRGTTVNVLDKTGDWYKVQFKGKTGYVMAQYFGLQGTMNTTGTTPKTVNATALNVRSGAGVNNSIMGIVKFGETVHVIETTGSWSKIAWYGGTAYVHNGYIK